MLELVQELKHFYPDRYVLFDLPPLLYADSLAFAPLVDGIILVVESGKTPREEIIHAMELLKEFPVLGFVLNKIDTCQRLTTIIPNTIGIRTLKNPSLYPGKSKLCTKNFTD